MALLACMFLASSLGAGAVTAATAVATNLTVSTASSSLTASIPGDGFFSPQLASLALQKVLDDSSQIFGPWNDQVAGEASLASWMARVPDWTPLALMNIPGIHDAATWNFSQANSDSIWQDVNPADDVPPADYFRCQEASMAAALEAGVRFFDLRYAIDPTYTQLVFWHSQALLSEVATMADVMYAFYAWLDQHPTETVLLSFQYEGSTLPNASNNASVQLQLFDILTSPAAQRYILQTKDELPTLGQARGKIVLIRRFDMDQVAPGYEAALPGLHMSPALWTDDDANITLVYNAARNLTAYIEDYYEPDNLVEQSAAVNIAAKYNATTAHLLMAASPLHRDSLFISFASAEHTANDPVVTPQTMALGFGNESTPLGGVNQQLLAFLPRLRGQRVGIVVLDFWDQPSGLVEAIVNL